MTRPRTVLVAVGGTIGTLLSVALVAWWLWFITYNDDADNFTTIHVVNDMTTPILVKYCGDGCDDFVDELEESLEPGVRTTYEVPVGLPTRLPLQFESGARCLALSYESEDDGVVLPASLSRSAMCR